MVKMVFNNIQLLLLGACACSLYCGCSKQHESRPSRSREQEIRKIALNGASREVVSGAFGEPFKEIRREDGLVVAFYHDHSDSIPGEWRDKLSGFQVYYKSNRVTDIAFSYSTMTLPTRPYATTNAERLGSGAPTNSSCALQLYVTDREEAAQGRSGLILRNPDLIVKNLRSVHASPAAQIRNQTTVALTLLEKDSEYLGKLTQENVGRILIMALGSDIILEARILSPITSGRVEITGLSPRDATNLLSKLKTFTK